MSSDEEFEEEEGKLEVVLEVKSIESSIDPPMEEWSSLIYEKAYVSPKRQAFLGGIYDPGSGVLCNKYLPLSDSSIFRHPYYKYPSVLNPGIEKALLEPEESIIYSDDGQDLYLAVCKEMNQSPVKLFHKGLLDGEINLKYYCVDPFGVRAMAMALQFNKYVNVLDLTDNFLNTDACYHLGDMLIKNFTLKELILSGCRIGADGAQKIFTGLIVNRSLRHLDISRNQLLDEGGEKVAKALYAGLEIKQLSLRNNGLGPKTAAALADALEFQNILTHLDLSWNNFFSPIGIVNLLNRLEENMYLEDLNLSWCALSGPRVGLSIKTVMKAPNLHYLDLSNNRLAGDAITSITESMAKAKKLITLNLSYNPMEPMDAYKLINKLKFPAVKVSNLLMDNVFVNSDFLTVLNKIKHLKSRKNTVITYGGVVDSFKAKGKDPRELVLNRAEFLCKKAKRNKVDIALVILELGKKIQKLDAKEFSAAIQMSGAPLDEDLIEEIVNVFPGPKNRKSKTINLNALVDYIHRKWPDRNLPPTPPPEMELEAQPQPLPPQTPA